MNALENTDSDIGFNITNDFYEVQNEFYEPEIKRVQVWIETHHDLNFWNSILQGKIDNTEFHFQTTDTIVFNDKVGTGCSRILNLVNNGNIQLGKSSIVCIDSDYHCISNLIKAPYNEQHTLYKEIDNVNYYSKNYIFRTLIHSKECAFYIESFLREEIRKCISFTSIDKVEICFSDFFSEISKIIKFYFISLLHIHNKNMITLEERNRALKSLLKEISVVKQISIINFQDLSSLLNSETFISLKDKIDNLYFELLTEHSLTSQDIELLISNLESFSVNDSNLFYFLRGHDVEDILKCISNNYIKAIKVAHQSSLEETLKNQGCDKKTIAAMRQEVMGSYKNSILPGILETNYQNIHQNQYIKIVFDCINDCITS